MKKYVFLTMVALLTLSLSVSAQDTDKKERKRAPREWPSAEKRAENLAKELDLTTDQQTKVQALFEKQDAKRTAHHEQTKATREQQSKNREEGKALREKELEEFNSELESIIGKEKTEQWNTLKKERWEKRAKGRKDRAGSR